MDRRTATIGPVDAITDFMNKRPVAPSWLQRRPFGFPPEFRMPAGVRSLKGSNPQVPGGALWGFWVSTSRGDELYGGPGCDTHTRTTTTSGSLKDEHGLDGQGWDKQNGIVSVIDLPSMTLDARTMAHVARDGWWTDAAATGPISARSEANAASTSLP